MKKKLFVMCLVLFFVSFASATLRTWDGPVGGNWMTAANWSADTVPAAGDDALVNNGGTDPAVVVDSTATACKDVRLGNTGAGMVTVNVNNGGTLQVITAGWMGVAYESGTNATLNINDGGSVLSRSFTVGRKGNGVLNIANGTNGGTLDLTENFRLGEQTNHAGSTVNMYGGEINMNINDAYGEYIALGYAASSSAVLFDMDGGAINMDRVNMSDDVSYITVGHTAGSTATFDMSGGTVNTRQFIVGRSGTATLSLSGTALIDATDGFIIGQKSDHGNSIVNMTGGTISNAAGSVLTIGYGSQTSTDAELNINGGAISGGDLVVGKDGKGNLKIEGGAATITVDALYVGGYEDWGGPGTLEYVIKANGVTAIQTQAVCLHAPNPLVTDSISNLVISLDAAPPLGDILLVDNQSENAVTGIFDSVNGGSATEGASVLLSYGGIDYNYNLTYEGGVGGNDVMLLIPEPATIAILGLGMLATLRTRKH